MNVEEEQQHHAGNESDVIERRTHCTKTIPEGLEWSAEGDANLLFNVEEDYFARQAVSKQATTTPCRPAHLAVLPTFGAVRQSVSYKYPTPLVQIKQQQGPQYRFPVLQSPLVRPFQPEARLPLELPAYRPSFLTKPVPSFSGLNPTPDATRKHVCSDRVVAQEKSADSFVTSYSYGMYYD
ncbi:hypothetical protein RvY_06947-2 [Ramazzottius varieornatus]|uniref:Uncharacterized protein n=1 Tax=Ramazzottius varieornatus TaxID=947166 RepID=A0A1D1V6M9_RAMVA|nr:hypothetical protein RvY_06947-2 [Ramazzottius varieornatus]